MFQEVLNGMGPMQKAKLDEESQLKSFRDWLMPFSFLKPDQFFKEPLIFFLAIQNSPILRPVWPEPSAGIPPGQVGERSSPPETSGEKISSS